MTEKTYDYVIVGAGAAGCVLASGLSEDRNVSVCVLEAGGTDRRLWARIPLGIGKMVNDPTALWDVSTEPECQLMGRRVRWISGRIIGGGGSVNGMLAVRGNPAKYDEWGAQTSPNWCYAAMAHCFEELEDCKFGDPARRGRGGPLSVSELPPGPLGQAFIDACVDTDLPQVADYNAEFSEGAAPFQMTTRAGQRCSSAVAFLHPALSRTNLTVEKHAIAYRVLFDANKRATGVEFQQAGEFRKIMAAREVILSAGAIRSPQLLELSGVGDHKILQKLGVPLVAHLPGVGENLQDHLMVQVCYGCTEPITLHDYLNDKLRLTKEVIKYGIKRQGLLASGTLMALAFAKSSPSLLFPDIRLQIGLASGTARTAKGRESGLDPFSAFNIGGYFVHPQSRGRVHSQSLDASQSPRIVANYLRAESDQEVVVQVLQLLRTIAQQSPLKNYITHEVRPGEACQSLDQLLQYARMNGETCWHPLGTCKMGNDPMSVVDETLRVKGVSALRVVDASVFPFHVSSNTNIPTIGLAQKASDLIRKG